MEAVLVGHAGQMGAYQLKRYAGLMLVQCLVHR